ncbi:MAG: DNA glycosylase [Clostridia bacterium]|nr:DNA glycosylase [Clostridia bacterium]
MKIEVSGNNIILKHPDSFHLQHIFECGQCFRWDKVSENAYEGIAFGKALLIEKSKDDYIFHNTTESDFNSLWKDYFDLDRDYSKIKSTFKGDKSLEEATEFGYGIRILNQDFFETVISFIISASNNIPRIKGIIARLSENFGEKVNYMGKVFYTFPTPDKLSVLTEDEIAVIRSGFRGKYIIATSKAFASGEISYDKLKDLSYTDAKTELLKLSGVGEKVANCILLFALAKYDSFPIDVWIKRIMEYCYFDKNQTDNKTIANYAEEHYGKYGGFAQQYLFYWARENKIGG